MVQASSAISAVTVNPFRMRGGSLRFDQGAIKGAFDPPPSIQHDRAMICGSMAMLRDISTALDARGFVASPSQGEMGDYVIERAFVG